MLNDNVPGTGLIYKDTAIRNRGERLNLTDMWRAAGGDDAKRPANWARKEGADFISFMADAENVPQGHIIVGDRGRNGATWAHWQIGLAYAKYLSPEFHAWCNTVVRDRMEGRPTPQPSLSPEVIGGIVKAVLGKQVPAMVEQALTKALEEQLPAMLNQRMAADPRRVVLPYISSLEIAIQAKVPQHRRKGIVRSITSRMQRFCMVNGYTALPDGRVWLWPREAIAPWLKDEGRALIRAHIAAVQGQGDLFAGQPAKRKRMPTPANDRHPAAANGNTKAGKDRGAA